MKAEFIAQLVEELRPHLEHIMIGRSGYLKVAFGSAPIVTLAFELHPSLYLEPLGLDPKIPTDDTKLVQIEHQRWRNAAERYRQRLTDLLTPYDIRCYFHWNENPFVLNEIVFTTLNARQLSAAWPDWRAP